MTDWPGTEEPAWPGTPEPEQPPQVDTSTAKLSPTVSSVMHAFGEGFSQNYEDKLGLSNESKQFLARHNVIPKDANDYSNPLKPFMAFNEGIMLPLAAGLDATWRLPMALYHGAQEAGVEAGLHRDIVSIPDAFMGSPGALAVPKLARPEPFVKPSPIRPAETAVGGITQPVNTSIARSVAAKTGTPEVDAVLNSPVTKAVIDNPVVDRQHDVPYMAGGSTPMEDPTVYIDRHVPKEQTAPRASGTGTVTFDPADPWIVHENVEQHTMELLKKGGMEDAEAYRVAHFEYAEKAEQAWYRAHDIDQAAAEREQMSWLPRIQHENPENPPPNLYKAPYPHDSVAGAKHEAVTETPPTPEEIARARDIIAEKQEALRTDGFIAYHGSPATFEKFSGKSVDVTTDQSMATRYQQPRGQQAKGPGNLYQVDVRANPDDFLNLDKPLTEQSRQVKEALGKAGIEVDGRLGMDAWDALRDAGDADQAAKTLQDVGIPGTSRAVGTYSVFDANIANITHVNGQPLLSAAKDLGVIGEPRRPVSEGTPAEAAARTAGGGPGQPTPPGGGGPSGAAPQPNPWRDRFDHFVGKLDTGEDVKQLIRNAADERGEFPAARQGDIKQSQIDDIAAAAGVEPGEINKRGLGRLLKNDAEVGTAMRLMLQATENMKAAAREVKADGSFENLAKLQESIMRRDLAVEQIVGLRAEWGRTGNVFQEFMRDVKDQESLSGFLKGKGRGTKDLKDIADAVDSLDRGGAAKLMNDLRTPGAWDKFMYHYVNALTSGPVTHAKYIGANGAFAGVESGVVTPLAGAVGAVRRGLTGSTEGVRVGETAARLWGLVAGTPDALVAAVKAARTGLQTPLPGQIAQNIIPKQNIFGQKPIGGVTGVLTLGGAPMRGASAIHSFFNFLGYRASIEAQAYRSAAKDGLSPINDGFWEHRQNAANNPTVEMMNNAIEEGARLTYINDLPPAMKQLTSAMRQFKPLQVLMPFMHIPFNILSRGLEYGPTAFLMEESRNDLFGKNGAAKQDMAVARMIAGSAVGTYAANLVLNDRMTGYGPTDPKERAQWIATGHQPYSIRIGDQWISYNRFGSVGTMFGLQANIAEAIHAGLPGDSESLAIAIATAVHATGRLMEDEVGMQGIANLIKAIDDPGKAGQSLVAQEAGSLLPMSSLLRQTASAMDPEMRQAKTFADGLRYYIPGQRQQLLPKRDWLGAPFTNAGYGGDLPIPGTSAIMQHRDASASAIALEMERLDLHPAVPQDRINGVKLPPQMYDQYQVAAGSLTRATLENWVKQPNWYNLPEFARKDIFQKSIAGARQQAGAMIQASHPEIIVQGIENQLNRIQGNKPTKLKDAQ